MHYDFIRIRYGGKVYYLLLGLLILLLSTSCSAPLSSPTDASTSGPEYVMTVSLEANDTPETIEARYGGHVLVWEPGVYAVLSADAALARSDLTTQDATTEPNQDVFLGSGQAAWMSGTSSLWAGGTSSLWAGGTSSLWAGGTSSLWSGGEFTWMPENTALWQQIRLEEGHALAPNYGYGVKVAVIDTGVDLEHPALKEALAPTEEWYDFYAGDAIPQEEGVLGEGGYGHGTNVAGIIRQVAPRATILPIRVLGPDGRGDVDDLAAAIQWAVDRGAQVINLSLGSNTASTAVEHAISQATAKGVLVVSSTGNTADSSVTWPASSAASQDLGWQRLSVTSLDVHDLKSTFATYGSAVELAAPGEGVYGPAPDLLMAAWSGTSMAAPMASGALALALGQQLKVPAVNLADEVRHRAYHDIYNNKNQDYQHLLGRGRLDLVEFLRNVVEQ